jgi:hypothetical protein
MDWIRNIKKGDVLRSGSGLYRIVRSVRHYKDTGTAVIFAIKRCSWTHHCVTSLHRGDLVHQGYRPTGRKKLLNKTIDRMIEHDARLPKSEDCYLDCCDVKYIP